MNKHIFIVIMVTKSLIANGFANDVTQEVVHLYFADVYNVITQKLAIANNGDVQSLQEAHNAQKAGYSNAVIYKHWGLEESLILSLEILIVADKMYDKLYDHKQTMRAGIFGNIPWPHDKDRPESLKGIPLWRPRQNPDDFKDKDPELYAFYKPFYEENQRNTQKYRQQEIIKEIRGNRLREVRNILSKNIDNKEDAVKRKRYLTLVETIIKDENLRKEILSGTLVKYSLPEKPPAEKTEQ